MTPEPCRFNLNGTEIRPEPCCAILTSMEKSQEPCFGILTSAEKVNGSDMKGSTMPTEENVSAPKLRGRRRDEGSSRAGCHA